MTGKICRTRFVASESVSFTSESSAASGDEVEDQDNQGDDQQQVNQGAGDMKAEAQQPKNQNDYENCPKH
jgi:hypothetical protein